MRYRPLTRSPSLDRACRLSRVRALRRFFSACLADQAALPGAAASAFDTRMSLPGFGFADLTSLLGFDLAVRLAVLADLACGGESADGGLQVILGHSRVPEFHDAHPGKPGHRLPVGPHGGCRHLNALRLGEAVVPRGDREAGGHPFHVVLERPGQCLVEVVQVEQQSPLRGGEDTEVGQVCVPAQLAGEPRGGRAGKVSGHDFRRATVERERGHHHSTVPDRDQVRLAGGVLLLQQGDRVGTASEWHPAGVAEQRRPLAGIGTLCASIGHRGVLDRSGAHADHSPVRPGSVTSWSRVTGAPDACMDNAGPATGPPATLRSRGSAAVPPVLASISAIVTTVLTPSSRPPRWWRMAWDDGTTGVEDRRDDRGDRREDLGGTAAEPRDLSSLEAPSLVRSYPFRRRARR